MYGVAWGLFAALVPPKPRDLMMIHHNSFIAPLVEVDGGLRPRRVHIDHPLEKSAFDLLEQVMCRKLLLLLV